MYDYLEAMKADVLEYISYEIDLTEWAGRIDELAEKLNDDLWIVDSVTGNGSGSYTFNSMLAKEHVLEGGADYLREACRDFCIDACEIADKFLDGDWEWMDVTIRCYLLGTAIDAALQELQEQLEAVPVDGN